MTILYTSIGHRKIGKSRLSFHELFNILLSIVWKIFVIYDTEKSKQLSITSITILDRYDSIYLNFDCRKSYSANYAAVLHILLIVSINVLRSISG